MKSSNDIANDIMLLTNEIDDLELHCNEDTSDQDAANHLAMLKAKLENEFLNLSEKVDAFGYVKDELESKIKYLKEQSERFYNKAKVKENNLKSMKERIAFVMNKLELKKLEGKGYSIVLRKPSVSLEVDPLEELDIARLPDNLWDLVKTEQCVLNKPLIKELLLKGGSFPFARLKEKQTVQIT